MTDFKLQTAMESCKLAEGQRLGPGHSLSPECERDPGSERHVHSFNERETGTSVCLLLCSLFVWTPVSRGKLRSPMWGSCSCEQSDWAVLQVYTRQKKFQAHGSRSHYLCPSHPLTLCPIYHFRELPTSGFLAFKHIFSISAINMNVP